MTYFGFELEVSGGARESLAHLNAAGLTQHDHFHQYHCCCEDCTTGFQGYDEDAPLFKAQQDCTADGEFITKVLEYGTPEADAAFRGISRALIAGGADIGGEVGNHVHVSKEGLDGPATLRLIRLMGRYEPELYEIAAAGRRDMRRYNGQGRASERAWTDLDFQSFYRRNVYDYWEASTVAIERHGATVEFRLWNATRAAWRLRTHVGLSVALMRAAIDGADCTRDDPRCLEDAIGDYLDAPTWTGLLRQRFDKGGYSGGIAA